MYTRVSFSGHEWRRVKTRGQLTTWEFYPVKLPAPSQPDAVLNLLRILGSDGESYEVVADVESDNPRYPLYTVIIQPIHQPKEARA